MFLTFLILACLLTNAAFHCIVAFQALTFPSHDSHCFAVDCFQPFLNQIQHSPRRTSFPSVLRSLSLPLQHVLIVSARGTSSSARGIRAPMYIHLQSIWSVFRFLCTQMKSDSTNPEPEFYWFLHICNRWSMTGSPSPLS